MNLTNSVIALIFILLSGFSNASCPPQPSSTKAPTILPIEHYNDRLAMLKPWYHIFKPQGDGPYPTVVYFHSGEGGDEGFKDHLTKRKVNKIVNEGYAVLFVEAFASRGGVKPRCLYPSEAADDVLVSFDWVYKQPWVDKNRIALFGNSFGGGTIMDALSSLTANKALVSLANAKAVILKEPFCMEDQGVKFFYWVRVLNSWEDNFNVKVPTLVTQGTSDEYYSACKAILDRNIANGAPVTLALYPRETHSLSPSSDADTWNKIFEFLKKYL
ncbi:MAG TPA: hypothetical protein EYQ72_05795 [Gammaproteobacteria bacterium]|jgi:dienelactone hydrolase|nr:hypothetical protein [Gammaproteobacteria bacterium]